MTRHAKASSAGSTHGQGSRSGSFVRGAFAIRDASGDANGSGARSLGSARPLIGLCLSLVAALALCASPALAAQTHPYTGTSFGPDGVGGSESFERVQALAVDPAIGDTYVYDGGAGKIYKFDSAGAPVSFSATATNAISGVGGGAGAAEDEIALAPAGSPGGTAGDIYVANASQAIHVYSAAGAELGELPQGGETCGAATDPSGNLYVGVYASTVNKYVPDANPPSTANKTSGTVEHEICNVAADGLGNVYAANYGGAGLFRLEGIADTTPTLIDPTASTMAIAPGSNDLYADRGNEVFQYDSSGTPIGSFGNGDISESHGVAVNSGATKIYVGTPTKVKVFGPTTTVPDVITEAAGAITKATATLHGTVGAASGPDATCLFQYTSASAYFDHGFEGASEAPCDPAGPFSGSATTPVSASATGLSVETEYRFRLLATSSNGSNGGAAHSFQTMGAVNVQTDPATNVTSSGARLNGTVNPEGIELDECTFEYRGGSGSFESAPCAESPTAIGSGNTPVPVHLDLTGLVGGTEYQFRLVGKNELGTNHGVDESFKAKGPSVGPGSVSGATATSATFHATVNPNGADTSYVFEYVTQADFESNGFAGATSIPTGGEDIGAGTGDVEVSATAEGLEPRSAYRFRVAASSADGTTRGTATAFTTYGAAPVFGSCPNERFRTGPSAKLPDCRAYEQVTPNDKYGSDAYGGPSSVEASPSGDGITSYTLAGFPGGEGFQYANVFLSRFAGAEWSTAGLNLPPSYGDSSDVLAWTPDLRLSFAAAYDLEASGSGEKVVIRDSADDSRTVLVPQGAGLLHFTLGGAFDDDSKVVFEADGSVPVTSGPTPTSTEKGNVYLYDRDTGELTLAGLLPDSACATPPCVPTEGSKLPAAFQNYVQDGHVVSPNGDIYFADRASGQLYLRRNAAGSDATTETVSASRKTNGGGPGGVATNSPQAPTFQGAIPDGSKTFFTSPEELTNDANTGPEGPGESPGHDLYRYEAASGELIDLAPDSTDPNGAEVVGLLGYSNDGSYVYFAANGDLDGSGPAQSGNCVGEAAQFGSGFSGSCSAYLWQDNGAGTCATAGGCVSFIAPLDAGGNEVSDGFDWASSGEDMKTSRVSADGRTLVFRSQLKLTSYDNSSPDEACGHNFVSGEPFPCPEYYRYDAESGQVTCLTCNPTGAAPNGRVDLKNPSLYHAPSSSAIFKAQPFLSRNLSPDGDRFFFQSPDKLVPADVNGEVKCDEKEIQKLGAGPSCRDVYEWEAPGTPGGSCTTNSGAYSPANGGCIYLLSTGTGIYPSYLADVSESGDTAFIFSRQKLVPSDEDTQEDIYAVKVDGGLLSQNTPRPANCEGDACRGASSQPSNAPGAGSGVFEGPGNPKQSANKTRCPKGKKTVHTKGKVRCVAKKHKKKAHKHKSKAHKRAANTNRRASR